MAETMTSVTLTAEEYIEHLKAENALYKNHYETLDALVAEVATATTAADKEIRGLYLAFKNVIPPVRVARLLEIVNRFQEAAKRGRVAGEGFDKECQMLKAKLFSLSK